jgi:hypothetical protein
MGDHTGILAPATVVVDLLRCLGVLALLAPIAIAGARLADGRRLDGVAIAIGIASAAAVVALLGIVVSVPFHLTTTAWLAALGALDILLIVAASRSRVRERGRRTRRRRLHVPPILGMLRVLAREWVAVLIGAAALAASVAAVAIAHRSAVDARDAVTFTQLWMVPVNGHRSAEVGIRNLENAPLTYRLEISGPGGPLLSRSIRLEAGMSKAMHVKLPQRPLPQQITATALPFGHPDEARRVDMWSRGRG